MGEAWVSVLDKTIINSLQEASAMAETDLMLQACNRILLLPKNPPTLYHKINWFLIPSVPKFPSELWTLNFNLWTPTEMILPLLLVLPPLVHRNLHLASAPASHWPGKSTCQVRPWEGSQACCTGLEWSSWDQETRCTAGERRELSDKFIAVSDKFKDGVVEPA